MLQTLHPPESLLYALHDMFTEKQAHAVLLAYAARALNCPAELLEDWYTRHPWLHVHISAHPNTPVEILQRLADHGDVIASNNAKNELRKRTEKRGKRL